MARTIPNRQCEILALMEKHGDFTRWRSGLWSYSGCPCHKPEGRSQVIPNYYATRITIQSMLSRGLIEVSETDNEGNPTRVRLKGEVETAA